MIELAQNIIGTQPILALFLAIGLGYLVGQINLGGFSLGVGAVLFVGLAIGAFAPKSSITGPIGLTGLIMFLYGIGILYGRQFFEGMTGAAGIKYNLLALVACARGAGRGAHARASLRHQDRHTLGIYAGSMTSTATLQAALDVTGSKDPSIGYSIAYPFGVIGPILCIYFMTRHVKPAFPPKAQQFHMGEVTLANEFAGRRLDDVGTELPDGVQITMVRKAQQNVVPQADIVLGAGDGLMLVAERKDAIDEAARQLGKLEPGRIIKDRSALDYIRVFVSKANVVGIPLAQLPMPAGFPTHLLHVRRYDMDIVPSPELTLEFGDRVGMLMPPDRREEIRKYFGDTVKATAEFSYVALGLGMVAGVLLGLIPIPVPGVGTVTLGIGGGSADRRADRRQAAPHRPAALGDAAAGEHRAAQLRACDVPRLGRHQCRAAVRTHRRRIRLHHAVHRHGHTADHRGDRAAGRLLRAEDPVRRSRGRRLGRDRQSSILVYSTRMAPTERPTSATR
jgi:putative transport protein